MNRPVYLDNNATTPIDPRVLEAMMQYFTEHFGNAASKTHVYGQRARAAVETARESLAAALGAVAKEIVFTSGATESNNIAIKGVAAAHRQRGNHLITQATEHKAVLDPCAWLEKHGHRVTVLGTDASGQVRLDELAEAITPETVLVSIMAANNEIGTLQHLAEIGALCRERGVLFHTDAAQAFGKIHLDVKAMNIDLLSASGHKVYGPKGIGLLYVRRRDPYVRCETIIHGGGHELGLRSGTLNVPGIVGFARAAELCLDAMDTEMPRIAELRDRLQRGLFDHIDELKLNGHPTERLANNLNVSFAYIEGESLMLNLENDIAVSSGSACTSELLKPSHVLAALGVGEDLAQSSLRFSLSRFTTAEEIDYAVDRVRTVVAKLREMSPLYEMAQQGIDLSKVEWNDPGHPH